MYIIDTIIVYKFIQLYLLNSLQYNVSIFQRPKITQPPLLLFQKMAIFTNKDRGIDRVKGVFRYFFWREQRH